MDAKSSLEEIISERFKERCVEIGQLSEIFQECLQKSKNASIYRQIRRNRLIDAFNPHQRSGLNASNQIVMNISRSSDLRWTLQMHPCDVRYKTH